MAGEILAAYTTGETVDAIVRNATGQALTVSGTTFGAYATANRGDYLISLTEQGTASGVYAGTMPAIPAGVYTMTVYARSNPGTPAESDTLIAGGQVHWDGTALVSLASRAASAELPTDFDTLSITSGKVAASLAAADVSGNLPSNVIQIEGMDATDQLTTYGGSGGLDAAGVRAAVGMASANLDTQLGTLSTFDHTADTVDANVVSIDGQTASASGTVDFDDLSASFDFPLTAEGSAGLKSTAGTVVQLRARLTQAGAFVPVTDIDATCTIVVREHGSGTALFTANLDFDDVVDGQFESEYSTPGYTDDRLYAQKTTIVADGVTTVGVVDVPVGAN